MRVYSPIVLYGIHSMKSWIHEEFCIVTMIVDSSIYCRQPKERVMSKGDVCPKKQLMPIVRTTQDKTVDYTVCVV